MRIEKINENQIRCTLTKSDLEEHQLLFNELAFGSDHAKDLFRDMMAKASEELGFEAEDIPLMIEAVPVSSEKLVLIITKMDNPDEIDEHMSKYMKPLDLLNSLETDDLDIEEDSLDTDNTEEKSEKEILSPLGNLLKEARKIAGKKVAEDQKKADKKQTLPESHRIYRFPSLAQTMDACKKIYPLYEGQNTLYKDSEENFYYLVMERANHPQEDFRQMGNVLSEFGLRIPYSYGTCAYFEEHFTKILEGDAVNTLSSI
ncbi:MAG: adaptor protein MecA [Lachnospiraceae bacterium]|nr:adaptor protein MecA [Lachnospiraceae bacterium]